jgi:hypothetical protein
MNERSDRQYVGEIHSVLKATFAATPKQCLFHDHSGRRCREEAIQSHSLQRSGPLASISESGHVIKIGSMLRAQPIENRSLFERVGLSNASVFPGFCATHDNTLFSELEGDRLEFSKRTGVLVSIRAISMELYKKLHMVELQNNIIAALEAKRKTEKIEFSEAIRAGALLAKRENLAKLKAMFRWYHKLPPDNFLVAFFRFERSAPFAATGAFEPEWDLRKRSTYLFNPMRTKWNTISFLCGNIQNEFHAIYAGLQMYGNHRIDRFLRQLDDDRIGLSTIFTLALGFSENCFIQESWKNRLTSTEASSIARLQMSGVFEGIRDPSFIDISIELPDNRVATRHVTWKS